MELQFGRGLGDPLVDVIDRGADIDHMSEHMAVAILHHRIAHMKRQPQ
jgi:hypothetical protein